MQSLSAVYFYDQFFNLDTDDSTLKKSLLFFDKVYPLIPDVFSVDWKSVQPVDELPPPLADTRRSLENELEEISGTVGQGEPPIDRKEFSQSEIQRYRIISAFLDKIKLLRQEKVLEIVDPRENLIDSLEVQSHILSGSALRDLTDEVFREIALNLSEKRIVVHKEYVEQEWLSHIGSKSGFQEDEWQWLSASDFCGSMAGTISAPLWGAFITNQVLLTAHRHNAVPVTPSDAFHRLMKSKISQIKLPNNRQYQFTLEINIPDLSITSFEDILKIRADLKDELGVLRYQIASLIERISEEKNVSELENEVQHIIGRDIEPAMNELQKSIDGYRKAGATDSIIRQKFQLQIDVWKGLPPLLVLLMSAGNIGAKSAEEYRDSHNLKANGVSILVRNY